MNWNVEKAIEYVLKIANNLEGLFSLFFSLDVHEMLKDFMISHGISNISKNLKLVRPFQTFLDISNTSYIAQRFQKFKNFRIFDAF